MNRVTTNNDMAEREGFEPPRSRIHAPRRALNKAHPFFDTHRSALIRTKRYRFCYLAPLFLAACTTSTLPLTCDEVRYQALLDHGEPPIYETIHNDDGSFTNVWAYFDVGVYTFEYSVDASECTPSQPVFED